jgi:hypothetical protein
MHIFFPLAEGEDVGEEIQKSTNTHLCKKKK